LPTTAIKSTNWSKKSPPLDLNSIYSYHLIAKHHANTSIVAEFQGDIVGFISAYTLPDKPDTLFIWQVAVDAKMRGKGIAGMMLSGLLSRPAMDSVRYLETTVNPSNKASRGLFERFSKERGYPIEEETFLTEEDFGAGEHESEIMLRIDLRAASQEEKHYAYN
jgi:L-2,4-diaminobutyric acid acetyltransferase